MCIGGSNEIESNAETKDHILKTPVRLIPETTNDFEQNHLLEYTIMTTQSEATIARDHLFKILQDVTQTGDNLSSHLLEEAAITSDDTQATSTRGHILKTLEVVDENETKFIGKIFGLVYNQFR